MSAKSVARNAHWAYVDRILLDNLTCPTPTAGVEISAVFLHNMDKNYQNKLYSSRMIKNIDSTTAQLQHHQRGPSRPGVHPSGISSARGFAPLTLHDLRQ